MQARTLCWALIAVVSAACGPAKPHTYGSYSDLAPKVSAKSGERLPQHVTIDLSKSANVAVFFVIPGRASQLLFPADSMQSGFVTQGAHEFETALAKQTLTDSSRLARRSNQPPIANSDPRQQNSRGRTGFDNGVNSFLARGYLLVYASPEPLPYSVLATRVSGISIPIDDSDALNTVTKLIRESTKTTGTWAAYATEFSP